MNLCLKMLLLKKKLLLPMLKEIVLVEIVL